MSSKDEWIDIGRNDPLWGVYTDPQKRHGGWEDDLAEFFATGERDVAHDVDGPPISLSGGHVLDFGCGVGRTTRALARRCDRVTAVDVSPPMLERARTYLADVDNVDFVINEKLALPFRDSIFDLVYSVIVLQHVKADEALAYIREFGRVVKPGGWVVFQIPTYKPLRLRLQPRYRIYKALRLFGVPSERLDALGFAPMRVSALSVSAVRHTLEDVGCEVRELRPNAAAGREAIASHTFYAQRRLRDSA